MAVNLTELCPTAVWKAEFVSDEFGYLPEEIPRKVLKMQLGFFFLLIVNYELKEVD